MESSGNEFVQDNRMILFLPVDAGIKIVFTTLIVKMAPLYERCNGDILGFFKETGDAWDMNGTLCSTAAMDPDELQKSVSMLEALGLQCERAPVDYYVLEALRGIENEGEPDFYAYWGTLNDGELEFYKGEDCRYYACLKGVTP